MNYFETLPIKTDQLECENKVSQSQTAPNVNTAAPEEQHEEAHLSANLKEDGGEQLDAFQHNQNDLSFACLLIPRFGDQYLTGDITLFLPVWMKEICVSYGWRLESIVVRAGYLQWVITVPTASNLAHIMRITRQRTSEKILGEFPRYKQQNLSGDFWAPGYSITSGNKPQSEEEIRNFIQLKRKQQGLF